MKIIKITLSGLSFVWVAVMLASCQPNYPLQSTIAELQKTALSDDTAWALLSSLTTDVGPRAAGTLGDAMAVAWADQKFRELGYDRVWSERVEFPYWQRRSESARIVLPRSQPMAVTALGRSPSTQGPLRAEIIHFEDLAALEAANPADVAGKIAFISKRMERSQTGAGYGETVAGRSRGPFVAARKGAAALVIRSVGTDDDRLPHTGNMSGSEPGEPVPAAAISNPDADLLIEMLNRNDSVSLELNLDCGFDGMAVSYNVIGEFDGRDDSDEFVVIGGHLDSWDLGTGAHDDGTGVSITMAAAKLVADLPERPKRGIRVVLFANEEQGIFGGKEYARLHEQELPRHVIGAESDLGGGRIYQFRTSVNEQAQPAMEELAAYLEPLNIPFQPDRPAGGGADIGQMKKLGMAVVDLNHDATKYFDLHHTANDTLDKVNPEDLKFNVAAYVSFIYFAAESSVDFGPVPVPDE